MRLRYVIYMSDLVELQYCTVLKPRIYFSPNILEFTKWDIPYPP